MDYEAALAHLAEHTNYDVTGRIASPSTERIERLMAVMGEPQRAAPAIHITGTNGKGSSAQIITRLLVAQGLNVGTYTSPHLERVNERLSRNGEPITDDEFAEQISAVADLELVAGVSPSYFEICTAAAFRWFADTAVDVMVVEVGLLGRWDATNVVDGQVAVVTNVGYDHLDYAGPTLVDVAREKAGIIKPDSTLVLGETAPELAAVFREPPSERVYERDLDFECAENQLALGGRLLTLRTPTTIYGDLYLPLNGRHQGDNAAIALTAVEAFFDAPLAQDVVEEGFARVKVPGRFEVLGHQPLVVVDGAHNPPGADSCAAVVFEDFNPAGRKILVAGFLSGRDPAVMLEALRADEMDVVICCRPDSPRAVPAEESARAARALGCDDVSYTDSVEDACDAALARATGDDLVLVTGSLYVAGAARPHLRQVLP
jgi:dihydrofolate synthase/folylpolyglutamate synthase